MKKSNFYKSIFRDMKNTFGKIFSIFIMIMLASMVIVGLFLSGATMRNTLNNTLTKGKHPDIIIRSSFGLEDEDKIIIEKDKDIKNVSYQKSLDLYHNDLLLNIKSKDEIFPKYNLIKGSDIKNNYEIVLDKKLENKYKIGDFIEFNSHSNKDVNKKLKNRKFKIVGFVNSTENLMTDIRDYSIEGKKMVDGFAFINNANFKSDKINLANISYKSSDNIYRFDDKYLSLIRKKKKNIEDDFKYRPSQVLEKIREESQKKLDKNEKELDDARKKLDTEEKKLYDQNQKLLAGIEELNKSKIDFENKIKEGENKLYSSKINLDNGFNELKSAKSEYQNGLISFNNKFNDAEKKLKDSQDEINLAYNKIKIAKTKLDENKNKIENSFKIQQDELNKLLDEKKNLDKSILELKKTKDSYIEQINTIQKDIEKLQENDDNKDKITELKKSLEENKIKLDEIQKKENELLENLEFIDNSYKKSKNEFDLSYSKTMKPILEKEKELQQSKSELDGKNLILSSSFKKLKEEKESAKLKLNESKNLIDSNESRLNQGLSTYYSSYKKLQNEKDNAKLKFDNAYEDLLENQRKLSKANKKFFEEKNKSLTKINEGYKKIKDGRENLVKLPDPEYTIENILSNRSIDTYYKNSKNMDELSKVFPTFFYFIALLVSLTTIKRYIEEQRIQNGTLKSLGYSNIDVANKFYIYALSPTILGSIIGVILGKYLISRIIFDAYSSGFDVLAISYSNSFLLMLITIALSTILIGLTVFLTSKSVVREQTADLLRPKPPKGGSRIFLEKITFLWNKMSFMTKITFRNLFRYKSRMFMTIFGIGGCVALLFFGFAMIDSIKDTSNIQRKEITNYDYINIYDSKVSKDERKNYDKIIKNQKTKKIYYKNVEIDLKDKLNANLIVFDDTNRINDFIDIRDKSKRPIKLDNNSLVVTTNLFNKIEDKSKLKLLDKNVKIQDVAENYIDDYIYMSKESYENNFSKKPDFNANIVKTNNKKVKDKLLKNKISLSIIEPNKSYETMDSLMSNLNLVIVIITLISAILAIVVLYNLTNVNVSERKKELATTKVLGFYPRETTSYIYRETYILTVLGIILGYILGYIMLRYVLLVVAPEGIFISIKTHPSSYIISALITLFISFIIMIIVHFRLKKINMAEAMKAGE